MDFTHVGELPPMEGEKHCHELSTRPIGRWFPTKVVSYSSSAQLLVLAKIGGDGLSMVSKKTRPNLHGRMIAFDIIEASVVSIGKIHSTYKALVWQNESNAVCTGFVIRFENGSTGPTLNHTAALTLLSLRSAHRNGGITL